MKICLVCSQGGHLSQMLRLSDAFGAYDHFFVTYSSDALKDLKNAYFIKFPAGNFKSKLMVIPTFFKAIRILNNEKPDLIISTGSGIIAIPFCYAGKLLGIKIIFIETLARITTPSAGGRIIYPIADLFLVQWQQLLNSYGKKAKYWGRVI